MGLPDFNAMYGEMAAACTGHLECPKCKSRKPCPAERANHYLRHGWPRCCGVTMSLVTKPKPAVPS